MMEAVGRAVSIETETINRNMDTITEKLTALQRKIDGFGDQNGQREQPWNWECGCSPQDQTIAILSSFGSPQPALASAKVAVGKQPRDEHCRETLLRSSPLPEHLMFADSVWVLIKAVSMATCCVAITICGLRQLDLNASVAALQAYKSYIHT
jgi:hypothetical protein